VVNGIKTTGYEVRGPDLVVRAWMTQEYPGLTWTFRAAAAQDDSDDDDPEVAAHAALAPYGFPVLLITLTPGSLEIEETVAIEQATLGAELFQIPAGYAKRTMPGGPQ
jgi:hypothetical protein